MTRIVPTAKQRETFLRGLNRELNDLIDEKAATQTEFEKLEKQFASETRDQFDAVGLLVGLYNEYSSSFSKLWTSFSIDERQKDLGALMGRMKMLLDEETALKSKFDAEKMKKIDELQSQLATIKQKKVGRLKKIAGISNVPELRQLESRLNEVENETFPGELHLTKIQDLFGVIEKISDSETPSLLEVRRRRLIRLEHEILEKESQRSGEAFEQACIEFVKEVRAKNRRKTREKKRVELKQEQERQRKSAERAQRKIERAEAFAKEQRAAKQKITRIRKFLNENNKEDAQISLKKAEQKLAKAEESVSRAEQSCIRKVNQIRANRFRLLGHIDSDTDLIRELLRGEWHQIPVLDNLVASLRTKQQVLKTTMSEVRSIERLLVRITESQNELEELLDYVSVSISGRKVVRGTPPRIPVNDWVDAEELALRYMRWLGFSDAKRTKSGADEGKDVESKQSVAQVKFIGSGATRPMLQQLFGVASAERKKAFFFSRSYAKPAIEWGEQHGIFLFKFDVRGKMTPVSSVARELLN